MYRFLESQGKSNIFSKNTYYQFLNESWYAWRRYLSSLAFQVISGFGRLTASNRINVLIIDDTVISRNRSKNVELLAKIYDHKHHKFIKGYSLLVAGWSDGYNMVPIDFAMPSSAKK